MTNIPRRFSVEDVHKINKNQMAAIDDHTNSHASDSDDEDGSLHDSFRERSMLKEKLLAKTSDFVIPSDPDNGYKGKELRLLSFARPHMRSFHGSWMCFCCGWLLWFSISPLLPRILETYSDSITQSDLWVSNMASMVGAIFLRIALGPLCDQHGAKNILTGLLGFCAIFAGLGGFAIRGYPSLLVYRVVVGLVGGALIPSQYWITSMFVREKCGTAMAMAAGWSAIGGGLAQVLVGSIVYPFFLQLYSQNDQYIDTDTDTRASIAMAWRMSLVVPATIALFVACFFYLYSDDSPLGSYKEVISVGLMQEKSAADSFRSGALNINAWLLFLQFGSCLGIELTMECAIASHLSNRFTLTMSNASAIASLYGLMNIFTRGFGGYLSDQMHRLYSLRGRLIVHWAFMIIEGIFILFFSYTESLNWTLLAMVLFASFGQMSMGTCFGIVPYIDAPNTGTIAGIVGAGGNVGAIWLGNVFRNNQGNDLYAFRVMGWFSIVLSCLNALVVIKGYRGIFFGKEVQFFDKAVSTKKQQIASETTLLVPRVHP